MLVRRHEAGQGPKGKLFFEMGARAANRKVVVLDLRNRPLRIIVTRPEPDAEGFAALARAAGCAPILSPVMTIRFGSEAPSLEGVGALAFTSANGVRAFSAVSAVRALPVFAVGAITAEEARKAGFGNVVTAGGEVESLAEAIAASAMLPGEVLHVTGAERAGDLVAALGARGVAARRAVLYEAAPAVSLTEDARAALGVAPPAEAVALFSPRSAALFIELVRKAGLEDRLAKVRAACLSDAVADAARASRWRSVIVAETRSGESLLARVLNEFKARRG